MTSTQSFTQLNMFNVLGDEIDVNSDIVTADQISPIEYRSYVCTNPKSSGGSAWDYLTGESNRSTAIYQIYAMFARLTDTILYVQEFMTYPHLAVCDSPQMADRLYKELNEKALEFQYGDKKVKEISQQIPVVDMYKLNKPKKNWHFADKEYADKVNFGYQMIG